MRDQLDTENLPATVKILQIAAAANEGQQIFLRALFTQIARSNLNAFEMRHFFEVIVAFVENCRDEPAPDYDAPCEHAAERVMRLFELLFSAPDGPDTKGRRSALLRDLFAENNG
jgi:hypothetical protein